MVTLYKICSIEDIFHRDVLPLLSSKDLGRLELVSCAFRKLIITEKENTAAVVSNVRSDNTTSSCCWQMLCERDFPTNTCVVSSGGGNVPTAKTAPMYSEERHSFDTMHECTTWKHAYQLWQFFQRWTNGGVTSADIMESIAMWKRLQNYFEKMELVHFLESLEPCLGREAFRILVSDRFQYPSDLLALYAVHGGQRRLSPRSTDQEFFAGLLGSYSCYNEFYAMQLINIPTENEIEPPPRLGNGQIVVGLSLGNQRVFLTVHPNGKIGSGSGEVMMNVMIQGTAVNNITVGNRGIIEYIKEYATRLEQGIYRPDRIIESSSESIGISLYPDAGDQTSCCVTNCVEIKASARWIPDHRPQNLSFAYSIRMRLVIVTDDNANNNNNNDIDEVVSEKVRRDGCQLIGRHWRFRDGHGNVRRVDGDAVIGKQPRFFFNGDGKYGGFEDLGPAGDEHTYNQQVFLYKSQSGPVQGTGQDDTRSAQIEGSFSFVPGSIEKPTGSIFHARVAPFPMTVPFPFY